MNYLGALLIVAGFALILRALKLVPKAAEAVNLARHSLADLRNPELDDDAKEAAMRRYAKRLLALFFILTLGSAVAALIPFGIIYLLDIVHLVSFTAVLEATITWQFIVATVVLYLLGWWILRGR